MFNVGIPLDEFKSELDQAPRRYFELHQGVTISADGTRFIIDTQVPMSVEFKGNQGFLMIDSRCTALTTDGDCGIYQDRPDICRNFNRTNKEYYNVPEGCRYES
jgi:Fe-S-cluster containining protein